MSKLVFYYGSMNSSKSAQLIMTAFNFKQQGKSYLVFKSSLDTRDIEVKSRALHHAIEAIPVAPDEISAMITLAEDKRPDFIFVDEVQFLASHQVEELATIVDELGIDVICYGLLTDFQSQLFEGSKKLVEYADSIREVKNQCTYCKNKANRNMRFASGNPIFEGETIMVGAEESYVSVCRSCYQKAKKGMLECQKQES